jgi:DNA ligase-1
MRFPRISRLRWDKPPREADRLDTLQAMLARIEHGRGGKLASGEESSVIATRPATPLPNADID